MTKAQNEYLHPVNLTERIRMAYDESPAHKGRWKHAIDFIVPIGTPIKAALGGVVVDVKQDSDIGGPDLKFDKFGNYIEIEHQSGEYSIYEHIKKDGATVKVGDKVKTGQVIGYSGDTGYIAHLGPHLHFDVHKYFGNGPEDYQSVEIQWRSS